METAEDGAAGEGATNRLRANLVLETSRHSGEGALKAIGILVVLALLGTLSYVIWNRLDDDDFEDDLTKFCARLEDYSQTNEVTYYESLVDVAPSNIRPTVKRLKNATSDIQELREGEDIEAYFRAAFDPEQEIAENELENYAEEECRLEDVCDTARPVVFC